MEMEMERHQKKRMSGIDFEEKSPLNVLLNTSVMCYVSLFMWSLLAERTLCSISIFVLMLILFRATPSYYCCKRVVHMIIIIIITDRVCTPRTYCMAPFIMHLDR